MRIVIILITSISLLMGFSEDMETFSADFEQHITDDQNKTLTYHGHLWSKRPNLAQWYYQEPIEKKVFIRGRNVTIVEPDLEQVIMRKIDRDIDLLAILAGSKPLGNGKHEAYFENQRFVITEKEGIIEQISYLDTFDNKVVLNFSKQKKNAPLADEMFLVSFPRDYDIIK